VAELLTNTENLGEKVGSPLGRSFGKALRDLAIQSALARGIGLTGANMSRQRIFSDAERRTRAVARTNKAQRKLREDPEFRVRENAKQLVRVHETSLRKPGISKQRRTEVSKLLELAKKRLAETKPHKRKVRTEREKALAKAAVSERRQASGLGFPNKEIEERIVEFILENIEDFRDF